ncbi:MAG: hypothetical protein JPMHGGIA_00610 [Saprospiraceae bacterium]|nr:hypothetical protein [Saprospiraceae bacterium]
MPEFIKFLFSILAMHFVSAPFGGLKAQCNPPMGEVCDESRVFCSLDELNGYACNNPSTVPSPCQPLCSQGGVGHNTSWWGFVTQGGDITITLDVGACSFVHQGLQYGIRGDCHCSEDVACLSIPCIPPNSVWKINANLIPCKTYYLWIDGCSGDVCDFTLYTSGGAPPSLVSLGYINNLPGAIIDPVCIGACNVKFFVDPQPGGCLPTYVWTLDGDEVAGNRAEVYLDFPVEGNFKLCITAYIGKPESGSICSQTAPRCATVKVKNVSEKTGAPRTLCWEQVHPNGYNWHTQLVRTSGAYRERITDPNCCNFDSVVFFTVLEKPKPPDVYYIRCDKEPYIDPVGKVWDGCRNKFEITLPNSSDPYRCDSAIFLTAAYVDITSNFQSEIVNDTLVYHPNIRIDHPCNVGEVYYFSYQWKLKSDSTGFVLSTDEHFMPLTAGNYILDARVTCVLGTDTAICVRRFEEHFIELEEANAPLLLLNKFVCPNDTFWANAVPWGRDFSGQFNWQVSGGQIISNPDSSSVQIIWNLAPGTDGEVQIYCSLDSARSRTTVCTIYTISPQAAGKDFAVFGKQATLKSRSKLPGVWSAVIAPFPVLINDPQSAVTPVQVGGFGTYCFEWHAPLKNCAERDTVCIAFRKIRTYDYKEGPIIEIDDSLSAKWSTRAGRKMDECIKLQFYNTDYATFEIHKENVTKSRIDVLDIQGRLLNSLEMGEYSFPASVNIPLPKFAGVCYIRWTINEKQFIFKIFRLPE